MDNEFLYEMDDLLSQGKFEEVIEGISALDEEEMTLELHLMLAHALSQCARYHEALDTLREIEDEAADDDIGYHLELAGALFGLHHYSSAIREARLCLDIDENCVEPWLILCLVYQETGKEDKFGYASERAKELDEEAWDNIFGDRSDELALYETDETEAVLEFISRNIGHPVEMLGLHDENGERIVHPINCVLVPPSEALNFYKIVSIGAGAYKGTDKNTGELHRIEMTAFLPPELSIDEVRNEYSWIVRIIRQFGEMLQLDGSWLAAGHTVAYGDVLDESVGYNGVIFSNVFVEDPAAEKCLLPCGDEVRFLRLIPLYEEEMVYKIENGHHAIFRKLADNLPQNMTDFIYKTRPNTCLDERGKVWAYPRSSIEELLDWKGADGCFATDRITVDGCRVGFMYREKPDNKFDSGWRFLAGDESEEYMNDLKNMDIFKLNTICNYDPDIIEFLESPVGSKFYRDKKGRFRRVRDQK